MKLKIAIVGCGKIADGHVGEIQKMDNAVVVAACDLERLMAEQLAARFSIPAFYDDFAVLLERERPDVVHVTTPPQSHLALARQAVDAGCHVYVEKPLAMNQAEARELLDHADARQRHVTVGHSFNFDPPALELRRMLREGVIGDPVHVESYFGYNLSGPFGSAILGDDAHWVHRLPGKLFHNNIDHMLNKILDFVPDDEPEVRAVAFRRRPETFGDIRDDMHDELRVFVRGAAVTATGIFTSHVNPAAHFARVYGTRAVVHADFNIRTVVVEQGVSLPSAIGRLVPAFARARGYRREAWNNVRRFAHADFQFFAGMHELIRRFYATIQTGAEAPISRRDMLRMSTMLDDIFSQIQETPKGER